MISVFLIFVGLALGSFVNALVWRLRHKRDWVRERSECVHCHHVLAAKDLVPILSYLQLRGKCRYCHKPIDDKPWIELAMSVLLLVSYQAWPYELGLLGTIGFVVWTVVLTTLLALTLYDIKWMQLPNRLVMFSLFSIALLRLVVAPSLGAVLASLIGGLVIGGLFYGLFAVSDGKWIGGGDVKLGFALGILGGGIVEALLIIFLSSVIGLIIMLPLSLRRHTSLHAKLPYGPFLIAAAYIVFLAGSAMVDIYLNLTGLNSL